MYISRRLKLIADLVSSGGVAADIGTDHALVPLYLLKEQRVSKAIAVDVSRQCLKKSQEALEQYNLYGRLEPRLGDGLEKLKPNEADSIIISGMGGILICRILKDGLDRTVTAKELILSPHRDAELVRNFLNENNFRIVFDEIITDKKKKYCVIKAINNRFFLKEGP